MNTLDILLDAYNWQGGTLTDAIEHFKIQPKKYQDHICNTIMDNLGKINDIQTCTVILSLRNENLIYNKFAK